MATIQGSWQSRMTFGGNNVGLLLHDNFDGNEAAVFNSSYSEPVNQPEQYKHTEKFRATKPEAGFRAINSAPIIGYRSQTQTVDTTSIMNLDEILQTETLAVMTPERAKEEKEEAHNNVYNGVRNKLVKSLFYGDPTVDPYAFKGLAARYNAHCPVIGSVGQGTENTTYAYLETNSAAPYTSIFAVTWGHRATKFLYLPINSEEKNLAGFLPSGVLATIEFTAYNSATRNNELVVRGGASVGLGLGNYARTGRICNIPMSQLNPVAPSLSLDTMLNLINLFVLKLSPINAGKYGTIGQDGVLTPDAMSGQTFIYMHPTLFTALAALFMKIGANNTGITLFPQIHNELEKLTNPGIVCGHILNQLFGAPIIIYDGISTNEAFVPAAV